MAGHIDEADSHLVTQVEMRKAQIDGNSAPFLFSPAVRVGAGQGHDQSGLAVVDVARGAHDDGFFHSSYDYEADMPRGQRVAAAAVPD